MIRPRLSPQHSREQVLVDQISTQHPTMPLGAFAPLLATSSFKASAIPLAMPCRYASIVRAPISPSSHGIAHRECGGIRGVTGDTPVGVLI